MIDALQDSFPEDDRLSQVSRLAAPPKDRFGVAQKAYELRFDQGRVRHITLIGFDLSKMTLDNKNHEGKINAFTHQDWQPLLALIPEIENISSIGDWAEE